MQLTTPRRIDGYYYATKTDLHLPTARRGVLTAVGILGLAALQGSAIAVPENQARQQEAFELKVNPPQALSSHVDRVLNSEPEWNDFSPADKLQKIITNNYPKEFNPNRVLRELQLSIAKLVCEEVSSDKDYTKLADTVKFYEPDDVITSLKIRGLEIGENDKNNLKNKAWDIDSGVILVNSDQLRKSIKGSLNPALAEHSLGDSEEIIAKANVLLWGYLLQVQKEEVDESFQPLTMPVIGKAGDQPGTNVTLKKLQSYSFYKDKNDDIPYLSVGGEVAEAAARIIASKYNLPYIFSNWYSNGANMVFWINLMAGVDNDDFSKYYTNSSLLMKEWNKIQNKRIGHLLLLMIGERTVVPGLQPRENYDPVQDQISALLVL